ncbi:hypothetical protein Nepgr_030842 [Nepenthes gracilis]|uniref:Uncharacterized protein n=1 Tax=Nepenthes gracilis TaxID=150966 RepID=A0AAD3TH56_NEPGR|nr:hypothetical protein Nepgr_030842 [Nepenthes gracilis]
MALQAHYDFPCLKLAMPHWYAVGFAVRSLNLMVLVCWLCYSKGVLSFLTDEVGFWIIILGVFQVAGAWPVSVGFILNSWVLAEVVLVGRSPAIALFCIDCSRTAGYFRWLDVPGVRMYTAIILDWKQLGLSCGIHGAESGVCSSLRWMKQVLDRVYAFCSFEDHGLQGPSIFSSAEMMLRFCFAVPETRVLLPEWRILLVCEDRYWSCFSRGS